MSKAWASLTDSHLNDEIAVCSIARLMAEMCAMSRRPGIAQYALNEVECALKEPAMYNVRVALSNVRERIQERIKSAQKRAEVECK